MDNIEFISAVVSEYEKKYLANVSDQTAKNVDLAFAESAAKVYLICEEIRKEQR